MRDRDAEPLDPVAGFRTAIRVIRANLNIRSRSFRHALRWGTALGIGVAAYHVVDLGEHGFWIPLTVLFVLKPEADDTFERIAMRAAGTVAGLALATALAAIVGEHPLPDAVVLDDRGGLLVRLPGDRVRAVHDGDHRLRRPARARAGPIGVAGGRRAGAGDPARNRDRGAGRGRVAKQGIPCLRMSDQVRPRHTPLPSRRHSGPSPRSVGSRARCARRFKGTFSAPEVAAAIARGLRRAESRPTAARRRRRRWDARRPRLGPRGRARTDTVPDPLGRPVEASFGILPDGRAVVEMARASGLSLLASDERDPGAPRRAAQAS